jgi:uncharacterized protein (DUF362 family)
MNEQNDNKLNRRQLLARASKAGLSIAAAGVISKLLYDAKGPKGGVEGEKVTLKDFSVQPKAGQTISIVKGGDRAATVNKAIELLGGIERFVKPGETVVIKPNVAFATPAMLCATANPELVAEVVRLCYNRGKARKVIVTDNPINDPASCFTLSGIGKAASEAGAEVVLPKENLFKVTTLAKGALIKDWPIFLEPFSKAEKLIGIAPVKNHHRAGASMTMKNWYGLLGGRRSIFHQDINNIITELAMMIRPTLVVLDGTEVMMTNGPTGGSTADLKRANTLIASTDCVAADSYGCTLLSMKVSDLPYLAKAERCGMGTTDYEKLKPILATIS